MSLPIHIGGLFRCCIATLTDYDGPEAEGTVVSCRWCQTEMVVRDGVWHFDERAPHPGNPRHTGTTKDDDD